MQDDEGCISGKDGFSSKTKEYGVAKVVVLTVVLYDHKVLGILLGQVLFILVLHLLEDRAENLVERFYPSV